MHAFELFIGSTPHFLQLEKTPNILSPLKKNAAFVRVRKSDTAMYHNDGELIDPGIVIMPLSLST